MPAIPADLRDLVRTRAGDRCEYCRIHQDDDLFFRFHVEHIIARQHGGETVDSNLALSCHHCNLHKGPNLAGIDPTTGAVVTLYHPRTQSWVHHFERRGGAIVGLTATGRATVRVLAVNARDRIELRALATHRE
ncbi:MAG TPA: HNH endonuclease signature motif containing protein [Tepidisphaeraceae bacterium]|nr:HNH endonuclease signature motif containing protein [Tepidisphaeraceae bacterium]